MGSSFGSTIIYNKKSIPMSEIESVFRNLLKENGIKFQARMKAFGLPAIPGMGDNDGGAMLFKSGTPWISTLEDDTISGFDIDHIGPHAKRYADSFDLPVITISVFDSDILLLAFCNPKEQPLVYATTHEEAKNESYLSEEYGITQEHMVFPAPLKLYATSEQLAALQDIWQRDEVFIEDIAYLIAKTLGFVIVRDQQSELEGYTYLNM